MVLEIPKAKEGEEMSDSEIINVSTQNRILLLPTNSGGQRAKLNWIQNLEEDYFLVGLSYLDGPYFPASDIWILKLNEEEGFAPVVCALYH